jgi:predicted SAM-dependent methyltransferase
LKKKLYKIFPFVPKINLYIGLKLHKLRVYLKKEAIRKKLKLQKNLYTNIGCGALGLEHDWINLDYGKNDYVTYLYDCRKELPFADGAVKGIFTEHFFEHLDYYLEVPYFLKTCYRILQSDGVLRIIIPDAEKYLLGYCEPGWDSLKLTRPLDDNLEDQLMGIKYKTKMQLINEVFRQGGQHKYAWDFETLKEALTEAGFKKIFRMAYMESNNKKLAIDQLIRKSESLYVEAIK